MSFLAPCTSSPTLCWCAAQAPGERRCSVLGTVANYKSFNLELSFFFFFRRKHPWNLILLLLFVSLTTLSAQRPRDSTGFTISWVIMFDSKPVYYFPDPGFVLHDGHHCQVNKIGRSSVNISSVSRRI